MHTCCYTLKVLLGIHHSFAPLQHCSLLARCSRLFAQNIVTLWSAESAGVIGSGNPLLCCQVICWTWLGAWWSSPHGGCVCRGCWPTRRTTCRTCSTCTSLTYSTSPSPSGHQNTRWEAVPDGFGIIPTPEHQVRGCARWFWYNTCTRTPGERLCQMVYNAYTRTPGERLCQMVLV